MDQKITQATVISGVPKAPDQATFSLSLFDVNGVPIDFTAREDPTGSGIILTGLNLPSGSTDPVVATDSVNDAVAKLQAQLDAATARLDALETP